MRSDIGPGGVFPDHSLPDHTGTVRTPSELPGRDPLILDPLILLLARGVSPRTAGDGHPHSTSPPFPRSQRGAARPLGPAMLRVAVVTVTLRRSRS
jgi:hypothetical protein